MADPLESLVNKKNKGEQSLPKLSKKPFLFRAGSSLPILLLLGFLLLLWFLFGEHLMPARKVEIARVVTVKGISDNNQHALTEGNKPEQNFDAPALFQASGWLEADPFPIRVATLYSGVVSDVFVLEGQAVTKGQLLAKMVDEDALLDYETAMSNLESKKAMLQMQEARENAAKIRLENWSFELKTAVARLKELKDDAERYLGAGPELIAAREISQANLKRDTQAARIEMLRAKEAELIADVDSRRAQVLEAKAMVQNAEIDVARKKLALDRTKIYSPMDGVIQELYAAPGMKRMLNMDHLESSTIVKLFEPEDLQARIDVPLEEVSQLYIGQLVRVRSNLYTDRVFKGKVTRIVGEADLQRNTVQVKVELLETDPKLRPDMLCRAEFLESSNTSKSHGSSFTGKVSIYVNEDAILEDGSKVHVWKLDEAGDRVMKQMVELGSEKRDGFVMVVDGLKPGDRVVLSPEADLKEGERIGVHKSE